MTHKLVIPKRLATAVDKMWQIREERYRLQNEAKKLGDDEGTLKRHILKELAKAKSSGIGGKLARVEIKPQTYVSVVNWEAFYEYVRKTKSFELLQRRVTDKAVKELWDDGKVVPGCEPVSDSVLSIHIVKREN